MMANGQPTGTGSPVMLGSDAAETADFLCVLRDSMAAGAPHQWSGDLLVPGLDVDLLCHLPPPDGPSAAAAQWRRRFRPGLCYYRRGPGFIEVQDARTTPSVRFVLDEPRHIDLLVRGERPVPAEDLSAGAQRTVSELVAEGLMLRLDGLALTLPHRMRTWPLPARNV